MCNPFRLRIPSLPLCEARIEDAGRPPCGRYASQMLVFNGTAHPYCRLHIDAAEAGARHDAAQYQEAAK